jgi:superoxide dismutase, Cu-Zn family
LYFILTIERSIGYHAKKEKRVKLIINALFFIFTILISLFIGSHFYYYSPLYQSITQAIAVIHPTKGNTASGIVTFTEHKNGLHISAQLSGLTPGNHGFHVHAFGDCGCPDAICAGDHFNPTHQPHGAPTNPKRHVGDFGNITADDEGNAQYDFIDTWAILNGPHSIIGRSVIVHADPDDLTTQPTGNAGARIGYGVIGIAKK